MQEASGTPQEFRVTNPNRIQTSQERILNASKQLQNTSEQRHIVRNPYRTSSLASVSSRLNLAGADVRRAAILADIDNTYEQHRESLSPHQQEAAKLQELQRTAELEIRFKKTVEALGPEVWTMFQPVRAVNRTYKQTPDSINNAPDRLYDALIDGIFQTTDIDAINRQYSRDQRIHFRTAVINFLDDLGPLYSAYTNFVQNPARLISDLHQEAPHNPVNAELTPFGIVITLSNADFGRVTYNSETVGINYEREWPVPEGLANGKLMLINKGGYNTEQEQHSSERRIEDLNATKTHLLTHARLRSLYEDPTTEGVFKQGLKLDEIRDQLFLQDTKTIRNRLVDIRKAFENFMKIELIALGQSYYPGYDIDNRNIMHAELQNSEMLSIRPLPNESLLEQAGKIYLRHYLRDWNSRVMLPGKRNTPESTQAEILPDAPLGAAVELYSPDKAKRSSFNKQSEREREKLKRKSEEAIWVANKLYDATQPTVGTLSHDIVEGLLIATPFEEFPSLLPLAHSSKKDMYKALGKPEPPPVNERVTQAVRSIYTKVLSRIKK